MGCRLLVSLVVAVSVAAAVFVAPASAQFKWQTLTTNNMRLVYYDPEHAYVLPHLARCFENTMGFYHDFLGYVPTEEVTILLQDFDDHGYAGTSTIPNNYITLGIEPFEYVYETCPTNERFNWVINHELFHVVASEKAAGTDNLYRRLFFGKVAAVSKDPVSMFYSYLSNPRRYAPRWYHEGIAVFMETWMAGGVGRSLGGYDEMVFRSMVANNDYFYDVVGLESEGTTSDFQIGQNSYLYGTRFMSHLAVKFGPEKVVAWVDRAPGTRASFRAQFRQTFGTTLDDEWRAWIQDERIWQQGNLARIREFPVTPQRNVGPRAFGSVSRGYYDEDLDQLIVAVNYPGEFAHVASVGLTNGEVKKVCEVQTPALYYVCATAYDPQHHRLYYTTNNGKHWRDLNVLDVVSGETTRLIDNIRTGDLSFNRADGSIWGVQHHNGKSAIVRIAPPYTQWENITELYTLPFGRDLYDLDVSPDGNHLVGSMFGVTGRAQLVRFDTKALMNGDAGYNVLYEFVNTAPYGFNYSADGRYVYGSAYQTGASNVFRFDFETEEMACLSNVETGYFRPVPLRGLTRPSSAAADSLIVFHYGSEGLRPVLISERKLEDVNAVRYLGNEIVTRHPVVRDWKLGSPLDVDLGAVKQSQGDYSKWGNTGVASMYPIVESYKERAAVGFRLNFMDPVGLHGGDVSLTFSPDKLPDNEQWHSSLTYRSYPWTLGASLNRADFYDFFGPTRTSRKGRSVSLAYDGVVIADKPRYLNYTLSSAYYGGLETDPDFQNVDATYTEFATASARLDYKRERRSIGAVDVEKGLLWGTGVHGNLVNEEVYLNADGHWDVGVTTPWDHSSLWLRTAAGYSFGDREDSFANFFFGGFGNNYVDHREVKRYRDAVSFPGLELNEVGGTNYAKAMLEWTLPAMRFRRFGLPVLYCTWARTALFSSGLFTNVSSESTQRELLNVGGQVDFRLVFFSGLSSTLSVGYAVAFEDGRSPQTELMISLRIL